MIDKRDLAPRSRQPFDPRSRKGRWRPNRIDEEDDSMNHGTRTGLLTWEGCRDEKGLSNEVKKD